MLSSNLKRVCEIISDDYKVLDVGGGVNAFCRANYVIDILPYDERRPVYGGKARHFSKESWVMRDICTGDWPFSDKEFDFVVCSHVLEDVRDPLKVCEEMIRVGKAGYIETPSRLVESTRGVARRYMAGHSHHRWLVEMEKDRILFTLKHHKIHNRRYSFKLGFNRRIKDEYGVAYLFWNDRFEYSENYPQSFDRFLLEFKKNETLKGKTEWKFSLASGIRKLLGQIRKDDINLPANILDVSDDEV